MSARGTVRVPGDKSISHRALICATLASGESHIRGILQSHDVRSTAGVLRSLGARIPDLSPELSIRGVGLRGLTRSTSALQCRNSGTTARLMAGVVAAMPFESRFEGDESLSTRPMKRIAEPLTAMGARFEFPHGDGLPMTVWGGALSGIAWNTRSASAQTKSAILLAALVGGVHVSVRESRKSRDHTERLLISLGVPISTDDQSVSLLPVRSLSPLDMTVPGDPSSAAFLAAFACLRAKGELRLPEVCMSRTRTGFLEALRRMGGEIRFEDRNRVAGDESATIVAGPGKLRDLRITEDEVPAMVDELPLLACVAAAGGVDLEVRGAAELRVKESDRITAVVSNLRAIGVDAEELPDGFRIAGRRQPLAGRVVTRGDHRIAMAFGILSALAGNEIEIDDRDCVDVSYPRFWSDLEQVRA